MKKKILSNGLRDLVWAGVDNGWEQEKSSKMPQNPTRQMHTAHFVGQLLNYQNIYI